MKLISNYHARGLLFTIRIKVSAIFFFSVGSRVCGVLDNIAERSVTHARFIGLQKDFRAGSESEIIECCRVDSLTVSVGNLLATTKAIDKQVIIRNLSSEKKKHSKSIQCWAQWIRAATAATVGVTGAAAVQAMPIRIITSQQRITYHRWLQQQ